LGKNVRHAAIAGLLVGLVAHGAAQQATPSFEVASIKANHSGLPFVNFGMPPGGQFTATNAPLREVIRVAYSPLPDFLIVGAPDWIRTERFDIVAKAEGNPERAQLFLMIRTLLADRVKLAVHREMRELPIYALVRAKPEGPLGPRLRPAAADCVALMAAAQKGTPLPPANRILCGSRSRGGTLAIGGMTMDQIALGLWPQLGRVVVDRTGLQGSFDLDLDFAPEAPAAASTGASDASPQSDAPSIFTAVQEQLGLKLESTKGPVEVLVIDRVERPTED
jgi:uncharacterized protein (TIGR03435 family)